MDNNKVLIEVNRDIAKVIRNNSDGTSTIKNISVQKLCHALASSDRMSKTLIPPNCRAVYEKRDLKIFLFITPAFVGRCLVRWEDHDTRRYGNDWKELIAKGINTEYRTENVRSFEIPYPPTAILVATRYRSSSESYHFSNMWAFTLKDTFTPLKDMTAYEWPFTNVYSDYHVCIGSIPGSYSSVDSVASIPHFIYNGVCNHDLEARSGERGLVNSSNKSSGKFTLGEISSGYQLIQKIHGKRDFPYEYLKEAGNLMSIVDSLLNNHM